MKRIVSLLVLLFLCVAAQAQFADGPYVRRGGHLKGTNGKLSKAETAAVLSQLGGEDMTAKWNQANGWRKAGIWMMAGGSATAVGGAVLFLVGATVSIIGGATGAVVGGMVGGEEGASQGADQGVQAGEPYMTAGAIVTVAGLATATAGIPILIVNCSKMNGIVRTCNDTVQLSLASGPNGMGLRLSF